MTKICTDCKIEKESTEFTKHPCTKDRLQPLCRKCNSARATANIKNRKVSDPIFRQKHNAQSIECSRRYKFGISQEQYDQMLKDQNGACKICGKPEIAVYKSGKVKQLAVDHDHTTGEIRGLLCGTCNTAIGSLNSVELLLKAVEYLSTHKNTQKKG